MSNPFEAFAGQGHLNRADKSIDGGVRKLTGADAAIATNGALSSQYKAAKRKDRDDAFAMQGGTDVKELLKILKPIDDPDQFLRMIFQNVAWLKATPVELRRVFLAEVDRLCQKRREDVGLPPIDDDLSTLWGEPEIGIYQLTKKAINL